MYVSYAFYEETFGGSLPAKDFPRLEMQAEAYIRALTYINGNIFAEKSDTVKMAVCAATEVIFEHERDGKRAKRSESNDGFSVTYVAEATDGQTAEETLRKKVYETVRLYLLPTGWLNRRVKLGGRCDGDCCCCDYYL